MMYLTIAIIAIAFYWLLRETDFLTIQLPAGKIKVNVTPETTETVYAIPANYQPSEFVACDLELENNQSKTIINVSAKILDK